MTSKPDLKIAIVSQYPREPGRMSSGVEGVVSALAGGLAGAGADVHIVTCVKGLRDHQVYRTEAGVQLHQVPSFGRLAWLIGFPVETKAIRSVLRSLRPDIVHVQGQTLYAHAALERGWPSLLTVHGVYRREVSLMSGWRRIQGALLVRFERSALKRAKNVIIVSDYLWRELKAQLDGKQVRLIENPIDDRYFDVVSDEEPGRILYAGTIIQRKDLLSLLEAVRIIASRGKAIHLRVAGPQTVEPSYFARCADFVRRHDLESRVDFLGILDTKSMMEELSRTNMLVLPSLQETAPMVVSEAMAAGKPVVATPAGGTAAMLGNREAGLIVPFRDPLALADAIVTLLQDEGVRRRMGACGRQKAEKLHRLSSVVDRTLAFYGDVIG